MNGDWRPTASPQTLQTRSTLLTQIRDFFKDRGVIEVQTPIVGSSTVTDIHIETIESEEGFLQTSPEYFMKRLLAAGVPSCYQIGPVFRKGESGRWHNPEFTMLEWYRVGFSAEELQSEVSDLVDLVLGPSFYPSFTFQGLIFATLGLDVFATTDEELRHKAKLEGYQGREEVMEIRDFLYSESTNRLDCNRFFVKDFPVESAALARTVDREGREVAERFELIVDGLEIANGYNELLDADELQRRMLRDNERRQVLQLPVVEPDSRLLDAMRCGLPQCSGVALGLDRLIALALGVNSIREVLAFPQDRA